MNYNKRAKKEYESTLGPKLILIAKSPLNEDKTEIFDSLHGMQYLYNCFKSKFKSAETHVTYVEDTSEVNFARDYLFEILDHYVHRKTLKINQLVIAFAGQAAFDAFKLSYQNSEDTPRREMYINEEYSLIKIFDSHLTKKDLQISYKILPSMDEFISNPEKYSRVLLEDLDNMEVAKQITSSVYCNTNEINLKLKTILELYKLGCIKGFQFNAKANYALGKIEYFDIYDRYTNTSLLYCPRDEEACHYDTKEQKQEFNKLIIEVLTTVPVYGNNIYDIISMFSCKDKITVVDKEDAENLSGMRNSFKIIGNKQDLMGTESEWYNKWYNNVFLPNLQSGMSKRQIKRFGFNHSKKYEWIYDIEVFAYDWLFVAKSVDGKAKVICWNDSEQLGHWMKDKILIGFNNAAYDDPVIKHAICKDWYEGDIPTVKEFSDNLIYDDEDSKGVFYKLQPDAPEYTHYQFLSWDISFHMPFDIRRNSLKKLTMSVLDRRNYDSSVSFDIKRPLSAQERLDVEKYCEMDVDNTRDLFLPDPNDVNSDKARKAWRSFAQDSYDIRWNLIVEYQMNAKTLINKSSSFAGKVLCGEDAKPNAGNTFKIVDGKKQYYGIPQLAYEELAGSPVLDFYIKNQNNPDYIRESFEYYLKPDGTEDPDEDPNNLYQFGFGGLHQALIDYGSKNLVNMDVASLYPSLLVQYKLMSRGAKNPESYESIYKTRLKAKKDGVYLLNQGLKLILNGSIGAMLSKYNALYDTWSNSTICCHGQLLLFILVLRLIKAGFKIIQVNTDGIMIETRDDVDYRPIADKWQEETRLILEFDEIAVLQQNNVNNYYCQFTNGKIKSKGFYLSNEKFGKATSKILCNLVTEKPYLEGTTPKDFVIYKKHSIGEIYDGITNQKLDGRSLAFVCGHKEDERTQSYYSRSRNERHVQMKDENGKPRVDENGKPIMETIHTISKITGFTDNMLLVDDINTLTMDEIDTSNYIAFAKNLLHAEETFGPYFTPDFEKVEVPACYQALNQFRDNTIKYAMNRNVYAQNYLFESDFATKEEQEEMIANCKDSLYRVTWSGNKSYHCIVRLDRAVTLNAYKKIWHYLAYKLGLNSSDTQCAIPSKYTRTPGQINPKTGNEQTLYLYDKNILKVDDILKELPKLADEIKPFKEFSGKITLAALKRHINRLNWDEGNRFAAVQKLSPTLISLVSKEELLEMIPVKLDRDHLAVIRSKYYYFNKYNRLVETEDGQYIREDKE